MAASVEALETVEVELAGLDAKQVTRRTCHEAAFAERLAHARDGGVERMACARGRRSPHNPSIRRSRETGSFASRRRRASSTRCFGPPSGSSQPSCSTSTGPRTRNSIARCKHCYERFTRFLRGWLGSVGDLTRRDSALRLGSRGRSPPPSTPEGVLHVPVRTTTSCRQVFDGRSRPLLRWASSRSWLQLRPRPRPGRTARSRFAAISTTSIPGEPSSRSARTAPEQRQVTHPPRGVVDDKGPTGHQTAA